jgi:hypothetical protein
MTTRQRCAPFFALLLLIALSASAKDSLLYLGSWSNGRGETLVITAKTLKFGDDQPASYRDVTRVSDGASFELEITTPGKLNAFGGKTLYLTFEDDAMKMTAYKSHAEFMQGGDVQSEVTWYRDEDEGADED